MQVTYYEERTDHDIGIVLRWPRLSKHSVGDYGLSDEAFYSHDR